MNFMRVAAFMLVASLFFLPQIGSSQERKPVWEIGAGVGLLQIPDYRGSDQSRLYVLPYPYLIYRGDIIKVDRQSISGRIFKTDRVLLDVSYYGSVPVDSERNSARAGMQDLDPTFEVGPALDITLFENPENQSSLKLFLPLRPVFSTDFTSIDHVGWLVSPRLNFQYHDIIPDTGVKLGISAGPMLADSSYHDYYYSVSRSDATPTRPAYKAGAGYSGATLTIGLSKWYKQFKFNAFVSADFLEGSIIEDSPLVKTTTSIMSGLNVSWLFFKSAKTIAAD